MHCWTISGTDADDAIGGNNCGLRYRALGRRR